MISRRTLIGTIVPAAMITGVSHASEKKASSAFRNFESIDVLKINPGKDGEIAYLHSYHQDQNAGGGFIRFVSQPHTEANMITSYPSIDGVWERILDSKSEIHCAYSGMLAGNNFDNTNYHNKLMKWADDNNANIIYDTGEYFHTGNVVKEQSFSCPNLIGSGSKGKNKGTILKFANNAFLKIKGGSGVLCGSSIVGITFSGSGDNNGLLIIADQCGISLDRCSFENCKSGVRMVNESNGGFTEFNVLDKCIFLSSCETGVAYERQNGNESFHGTGLRECVFQQQKLNPNAPHIHIGPRCLVYNAPMTIHVFRDITDSPIINHDGFERSNVYGIITVEKKPKNLVNLVLGKPLYIIGSVVCLSENLSTNNAIFCSRFQANSDGSVNFIRNPASLSGKFINSSKEPVLHLSAGESAFLDLSLITNGRVNRGLIFIAVDENGNGKITNTELSPISVDFKHENYISFEKSTLYVSSNGDNNARWIADIAFVASRFQYTMQ
ncbi:TPA: hypothetical protein PIP11_003773 [Klebsiella aerogenes]|uniref:hypothetical protein n=1 Tax=Klebsiella aerogenes TaxID=548 RepID=UPI0018692775|nr:hypothetical protein [Klebsiella aerogenes]HDH0699988.1 hypothetical protein [Klebsiella aerogenes]